MPSPGSTKDVADKLKFNNKTTNLIFLRDKLFFISRYQPRSQTHPRRIHRIPRPRLRDQKRCRCHSRGGGGL